MPTRGVIRFEVRGKLSPRYVGSFDILERVGDVAYRLALPTSLRKVHDVFHVSQLCRYVSDPSHVLDDSELVVGTDLTYEEQPVSILDQREKMLKNRTIRLVRVTWGHHSFGESTWEREGDIRSRYPHLFDS